MEVESPVAMLLRKVRGPELGLMYPGSLCESSIHGQLESAEECVGFPKPRLSRAVIVLGRATARDCRDRTACSRETLAIYQDVALDDDLERKYQNAMKEAGL